jgi:DNA-binding GntR family transcriptional regulator
MFDKQHPISNTIKQQVYQIIKDQICKGIYSPGKWLQEKELANEFRVSRSPVREALRQLASDGLVVEVPHKGVFVKKLTPKDIEDIFDVRLLLESYAIDRIPQHLNEENKAALKACLDDLINAYNENDLNLYIEHDTRLHNMLIDMSGNNLIKSTYEKVMISQSLSLIFGRV